MKDLKALFNMNEIYFEVYNHKPIYTNEDAVIMKGEYGFKGTETKSFFLKDKFDHHYIFLTFTNRRINFNKLNSLIGEKLSIVPTNIMEKLTGQKSGAVSPFGYDMNVPVIIDSELLAQKKLVFAPGLPDQTMVIKGNQIFEIVKLLDLDYYIFDLGEDFLD